MDPNVALENILRGYMVTDHAEALEGWLARDGFAPEVRTVPPDCADFVAEHCKRRHARHDRTTIRVRADRNGLWTAPPEGAWVSLMVWGELKRILSEESEA